MSCNYNRHQAQRKKEAALAAAFPQGIKCQKCLEYGHWSYECKGKRKILVRPSRTQVMKKKLKESDSGICFNGKCEMPKKSSSKSNCKDGKCGPKSSKGGKCGQKSCKGGKCDDSSESEDSDSSSDCSEDSSGSDSDSDSDDDSSSGSGSESSD